jgi:hypothetical protein
LSAGVVVNEFGLAVEVQFINAVNGSVLLDFGVIATNETSILSESETSPVIFGANIAVFAVAKQEVQHLPFGKTAVEVPHNR